jgi:glycosyltransferase involved in cell wall biosynthesis
VSAQPVAPADISVVVPVFDRARSLARALASIAHQALPPREVIVVDDGSRDGSGEVAARAGVRVLTHAENQGQVAARNTGVAAATQPWVAFLDSDDEWLPDHLEELWGLTGGVMFVAATSINRRSGSARPRLVGPLTRRPVVVEDPWRLIHPHNFVTMSAAMVSRAALEAVGGFHAHDGVVEDLDLWVRLLERGPGRLSPRVTVVYHVHRARITDDLPRTRAAHMSVARGYVARSGRSPRLLERHAGAQAWDELRDCLELGCPRAAAARAMFLVSSPARLRGVGELLVWRARARRATARAVSSR